LRREEEWARGEKRDAVRGRRGRQGDKEDKEDKIDKNTS